MMVRDLDVLMSVKILSHPGHRISRMSKATSLEFYMVCIDCNGEAMLYQNKSWFLFTAT